MTRKTFLKTVTHWALPALAAVVGAIPALGAEYTLYAGTAKVSVAGPDGKAVSIDVWGYGTAKNKITVPGPMLTVPPNDSVLTVRLVNCLSVPTSIVIPGLKPPDGLQPVYTGGRVRSFTAEAPADCKTQVTYTWNGVRPGTYVYHSGTHPQVQVQMGLYGAATMNAGDGLAYSGVGYDKELVLLYNEFDPALHAAVASGNYGPGKLVTSTFNYDPRYFAVHTYVGGAWSDVTGKELGAGQAGQRVLLRLVSAAIKPHAPMLLGSHMRLVAEDAYPYGYARQPQYSVYLPPLKTMDAVWQPAAAGVYPFFDRGLDGMLTKLKVDAGVAAVARDDAYSVKEGATLSVPAPGVLANDTGTNGMTVEVVSGPTGGALTLAGDGSFVYTPTLGTASDSFRYQIAATDATATVTITVSDVNQPPVARDDGAQTRTSTPVVINVLSNDTDPDGDPLTVSSATSPTNGAVVVNADQTVTYTPNASFTGTDTFTYTASDGKLASNTATVTVSVGNAPPVANDDYAETKVNTLITINVVSNDTDDGNAINPASVVIVDNPTQGGTVVNNLDGTVTYTPRKNFRGTDNFTYTVKDVEGLVSNKATVRVNVVR